MQEETTSRVMASDRPYSELYDFYSVSQEYFGYTLVYPNIYSIRQLSTGRYVCQ
jgi:hypothetical protein